MLENCTKYSKAQDKDGRLNYEHVAMEERVEWRVTRELGTREKKSCISLDEHVLNTTPPNLANSSAASTCFYELVSFQHTHTLTTRKRVKIGRGAKTKRLHFDSNMLGVCTIPIPFVGRCVLAATARCCHLWPARFCCFCCFCCCRCYAHAQYNSIWIVQICSGAPVYRKRTSILCVVCVCVRVNATIAQYFIRLGWFSDS